MNDKSPKEPDENKPSDTVEFAIKELSGIIKAWIHAKHSHDSRSLIIFLIIVVIISGTVITLGAIHILHESSIAPILGSLIGYGVGRFANGNNGKER